MLLMSTDEDECHQVIESFVCIMEQTMRIYHRKVDYISEPDNPLIQIPIKAICEIAQSIDPHYLGLTTEKQKTFL